MVKPAIRKSHLTKGEFLANIAATAELPKKQVAAVLEALIDEIRKSLSTKGAGVITIPGFVKIERKTVPTCPTWPASIKVTVVPELLPGPDAYCARGLHTYHESPATNEHGYPICGACGKDEINWKRLHERDIADVDYTIAQLKTDRFRNKWWFRALDENAARHASRKGSSWLTDTVRKRVETSVGPRNRFAMVLRRRSMAASSTTGSTRRLHAAASASKSGTGFPGAAR